MPWQWWVGSKRRAWVGQMDPTREGLGSVLVDAARWELQWSQPRRLHDFRGGVGKGENIRDFIPKMHPQQDK